jgi:hypothetical protein
MNILALPLTAALFVVGTAAALAQVNGNTPDPPPKPPTYTPAQLFGTATPPSSTSDPQASGLTAPQNTQPSPPIPANISPNTSPSGATTRPCPTPASPAPTSTPQFPGVSASQFRRAGVSAEAFTRPGVSAEQLNGLVPGNRLNACPTPTRNVLLYPEPVDQPRRILSASDEP